MEGRKQDAETFSELISVMAELRGEKGCPWDKEQTHSSLKPSLLEESYELLDAIDGGDPKELQEELGDLLHQIIFHCQIASEEGHFTIQEVVTQLKEKMVRRHPHVFSDRPLADSNTVLKQWARIKAGERESNTSTASLGQLPRAMPALARAQRITERASHLGFDWPQADGALKKIEEELGELKAALPSGDKSERKREMGDLLFSLVNLCRFLDLEAEDALSDAIQRFLRRFEHIETKIRAAGRAMTDASLEEMDSLWEEAKRLEKEGR